MNLEEKLTKHFKDDFDFQKAVVEWQKKHEADHQDLTDKLASFITTMTPLTELANTFKAGILLRRPSLWILAVVLGLVAFFGGVKSLLALFISFIMPK